MQRPLWSRGRLERAPTGRVGVRTTPHLRASEVPQELALGLHGELGAWMRRVLRSRGANSGKSSEHVSNKQSILLGKILPYNTLRSTPE